MGNFPIDGDRVEKFQYLQKRFDKAKESGDKEGQTFYNEEIGKLLNDEELSNSEIKARETKEREERILREEIKKLNERTENLAGKPYLEGVIQPKIQQLVKNPADFSMKNRSLQEEESHGVKIFLIII